MKRKKHLTDCKMTCLFKKKKKRDQEKQEMLAEDCSNNPKAPWLSGEVLTALRHQAPQRRRQNKTLSRFVAEVVLFFTLQRGSRDPNAAAQHREVQTHSTAEPAPTQASSKVPLPANSAVRLCPSGTQPLYRVKS